MHALAKRGAHEWLFSERREKNPSGNHSGAATVVRHRSTGTRCSGAVSRGGLGERLELILPGSSLLKPNGCPIGYIIVEEIAESAEVRNMANRDAQ